MKMAIRFLLLVAVLALIMTGCGGAEESPEGENPVTDVEQTPEENTDEVQVDEEVVDTPKTSLVSDKDLEQMIGEGEGIKSVMVQVEEGDMNRVNVDLEITDNQEIPPEQLADTYADVIKEKYHDYTVDIIVVQDGKLLTQKTYE